MLEADFHQMKYLIFNGLIKKKIYLFSVAKNIRHCSLLKVRLLYLLKKEKKITSINWQVLKSSSVGKQIVLDSHQAKLSFISNIYLQSISTAQLLLFISVIYIFSSNQYIFFAIYTALSFNRKKYWGCIFCQSVF